MRGPAGWHPAADEPATDREEDRPCAASAPVPVAPVKTGETVPPGTVRGAGIPALMKPAIKERSMNNITEDQAHELLTLLGDLELLVNQQPGVQPVPRTQLLRYDSDGYRFDWPTIVDQFEAVLVGFRETVEVHGETRRRLALLEGERTAVRRFFGVEADDAARG